MQLQNNFQLNLWQLTTVRSYDGGLETGVYNSGLPMHTQQA